MLWKEVKARMNSKVYLEFGWFLFQYQERESTQDKNHNHHHQCSSVFSFVRSSMEIEVVTDEITEVSPEPSRPPVPPPESAVYVAVGKGSSSMDALCWALKHDAHPSTSVVFLIHIFPEIHYVPTPLGSLQKSKVNPQQLESYMIEVRSKRREMLQKFINRCRCCGVEADTILIESDQVAKAIVDLIDVLQIKNLVIGASKSSVRKFKKGGGGGKEEQILKGKPDYCEVKIICDGKDVTATDQMPLSSSTPPQPTDEKNDDKNENQENNANDDAVRCGCF